MEIFCEYGDELLGFMQAGNFFTKRITIKYSRYILYIKELLKSELDIDNLRSVILKSKWEKRLWNFI
jgi:hypothetical protein